MLKGLNYILIFTISLVILMALAYSNGAFGQEKYSYLQVSEIPDQENGYTEILEKRTENTQTFTNGTDSFIKIYIGDRFIEKSGQLLPFIDTFKINQTASEMPYIASGSVIQDIMGLFTTKTAWATLSATVAVDSGKDTSIISTVPNNNYGSSDQRSVGEKTANAESSRILIGATLPAQPTASAAITKIELKAYKIDNAGATNDTSEYVQAHMLTRQNWKELETTYNAYITGSNWDTAGGDFESTYLYRNSVGTDTAVWRNWILYGTGTNHDYDNPTWGTTLSVILKMSSGTPATETVEKYAMREYATSTLRPYFVVYYDYPEPTPTPTPPENQILSTSSVELLQELIRTGNGTNLGLTFLIFFEMLELLILIYGIKNYVG